MAPRGQGVALPETVPPSAKIPPEALPRSAEAALDWLRLARSRRIGPATFGRLVREHGSASAALAALPGVAAEAGLRDYAAFPRAAAEAEWLAGTAAGGRALFLGSADYPPLLATVADAPPLLWAIGDPGLAARPVVALVGARNASALGCRMASRLAADLGAAGFVVASGLARGIDAAAHRAALATGTIAAQAGGVDVIYPPENAGLAAEIAAAGLRLSEMPVGHEPRAQDFPAAQPHRLGPVPRRRRHRGGSALGEPDHGAQRPRPGARGDGGARQPARRARRRLQRPDPRRRRPRPRRGRCRRGPRGGARRRAAAHRAAAAADAGARRAIRSRRGSSTFSGRRPLPRTA